MRLPTPKQKENGKWLIQVMLDGKRVGKEFATKDEAYYWAAGIKTKEKLAKMSPKALTVGEAIDRHIDSKDSVLSPSTVSGYRRIRKNQMGDLENVRLGDLTQEKIQRWINKLSKDHSPKTVKNAHGLLTSTLNEYYPDLRIRIVLPQKEKAEIVVPTEQDIVAIAQAVKGKSVELPVLLAMWLGLRMSEILGLTWDCIDGDTIRIKQARIDEGLKTTKTYSSNRVLPLPRYIKSLLDERSHNSEFIFPDNRRAIASRFDYYLTKNGIKHYRFHDLRHVNASVMLALNIPSKYASKRLGHSTDNMIKTVYEHTMPEVEKTVSSAIDNYFEEKLQPILQPDK